jgi:hypothetical protein
MAATKPPHRLSVADAALSVSDSKVGIQAFDYGGTLAEMRSVVISRDCAGLSRRGTNSSMPVRRRDFTPPCGP